MRSLARVALLAALVLAVPRVGSSQEEQMAFEGALLDEALQWRIDSAVASKSPSWTLLERSRMETNMAVSRWDAGSMQVNITTQHWASGTDADQALQGYCITVSGARREVEGIGDKAYVWENYSFCAVRFRKGNVVVSIVGHGNAPAAGPRADEAAADVTEDKTKPRTLNLAQPVSRDSLVSLARAVADEIE